ncbi:MAG: hypothetical protein ABI254_11055 [Chthoniobacterales bacterium]
MTISPLSLPSPKKKTRSTAEAGGKKSKPYKTLATFFCKDGFTFRQIVREGNAAIYEQVLKGRSNPSAYEVVIIRKREAFKIGNRSIEAAEYYPKSDEWGSYGWTVKNREDAFAKLREVV